MNINKKYKDSVFSFLFREPDKLRELYSAIEGVTLPPDTLIDINTLSDMMYMEQINDLSFTIDNRLVVLIEHQSTINQNMPLRLLMYIAHVYEKIIDRKKLYHSKIEKIPAPEFIVLYNGKEEYPDYSELKLSDAFKSESLSLELTVKVYNINYGHNSGILKKSETLDGYSFFVEKVREYEKLMPFEEAFKEAIKYCIDHNIMRRFFENHGSEVYNMSLWGLSIEDAREAWYEEAHEEGYAEGKEKGIAAGIAEGREAGIAEGREAGIAEGREEGKAEGIASGMKQGMIEAARNAFAEGLSVETIQRVTGLDLKTIENIQKG